MHTNQPFRVKNEMRRARDFLLDIAPVVAKVKIKIPGDKAVTALRDLAGDHKARLLQRHEHVRKNAPDRIQALHIIEWIFELRIRRINARQPG